MGNSIPGCFLIVGVLLGRLGMVFGGGKCIIEYSIFICIEYTPLCTPAGVVWDGLATGTLDDILFIGHVINDSLGGTFLLFSMFCMVFYGTNDVYR